MPKVKAAIRLIRESIYLLHEKEEPERSLLLLFQALKALGDTETEASIVHLEDRIRKMDAITTTDVREIAAMPNREFSD